MRAIFLASLICKICLHFFLFFKELDCKCRIKLLKCLELVHCCSPEYDTDLVKQQHVFPSSPLPYNCREGGGVLVR